MPLEITNSNRGPSVIRVVDPGSYTITLNDLRANATTETVTGSSIKRVMWSTNGNITIVRNSVPILALHNAGDMVLTELGQTLANTPTGTIGITITTGGTALVELSKTATYTTDLTGI